jgi:N utilization substance protein A
LEKIFDILNTLSTEKGLNPSDIKDALRTALINTAKEVIDNNLVFDVIFDDERKRFKLYQKIDVVDDTNEDSDSDNFLSLSEAKNLNSGADIGDQISIEIDINDYGRVAAMTLSKYLDREIRKLIETQVYNKYKNKVNKVVAGIITKIDMNDTTYLEIDDIRAFLPQKNRIKDENFKVGNIIKVLVKNVDFNSKKGLSIELSRTSPRFLEELVRLEVPEIREESISIYKSARIPGRRSKLAIIKHNPNIDPIGSTVGTKGMRINAISRELKGESIDVVEYSPVAEIFVSRAMSPAIVTNVTINDKKATVTVPFGQKAKAIGKEGLNIRLVQMLTGYEIELLELDEDKSENANMNALEALFNAR